MGFIDRFFMKSPAVKSKMSVGPYTGNGRTGKPKKLDKKIKFLNNSGEVLKKGRHRQ